MLACLQVIGHHEDFLRKVLKGCLLSRKLTLLNSLTQLKHHAGRFIKITASLHVNEDHSSRSTADLDIVPAGELCKTHNASHFATKALPPALSPSSLLVCTSILIAALAAQQSWTLCQQICCLHDLQTATFASYLHCS